MGVEVGQDATSVLANGLGQMTKRAEAMRAAQPHHESSSASASWRSEFA